jgi:hypothetical protein
MKLWKPGKDIHFEITLVIDYNIRYGIDCDLSFGNGFTLGIEMTLPLNMLLGASSAIQLAMPFSLNIGFTKGLL